MDDVIFRQYDIRGKVGSELDIDQAYDLARAIAYYFVQKNPQTKTVAVGMDGRTHSPVLRDKVCAAIRDSGLNVEFIGMCTSPALYFAMHTHPFDAGIMVTASHNGKEYNGFKICVGKTPIFGSEIQVIKQLFKEKKRIEADHVGSYEHVPLIEEYVDWVVDHFKHLKGIDFPVVLDCGNGAAGTIIPLLVEKMGWRRFQVLFPEVDGTYPNHEANPIEEKNMIDVKHALATTEASVGIGFDGDGDRMAAMTKEGFLVPGDIMLGILSKPVVINHPGAVVVFDITCSGALAEMLVQWGARPCMSPTGSSYIKQYMKENKALVGGEMSCHFFFADRFFGFDDGIYAMIRLVELLYQSKINPSTGSGCLGLADLVAEFPRKYSSPSIRIPCPDEKKEEVVAGVKNYFVNMPDIEIVTVDGIRVTRGGSWGLVRASNTEPKLSMRFESDSPEGLREIEDQFMIVLKKYIDEGTLRKYIQRV
jgi:phosphomannomutase/phosphoglucomutase